MEHVQDFVTCSVAPCYNSSTDGIPPPASLTPTEVVIQSCRELLHSVMSMQLHEVTLTLYQIVGSYSLQA